MAIKSYVVPKEADQHPFSGYNLHVRDCMVNRVTSFRVDQGFREAVAILLRNRISSAPVIYPDGKLAGIISEGDILKRISLNKYHNMPTRKVLVAEMMSTNVITVSSKAKVYDLVDLFLNEKKRSFPVVDDGHFVGMISQKDVVKALFDLKFKY